MKLEQLRSFEAVARIGHFTRAAEELYLAQPSLSRQIGALEAELDTPLLRRNPAGVTLTAAGETLLPIARRMLADARSAREQLDELAGLRRGRVRLGAPPTLCVSLVAEVLAAFRIAHPGIDLHITEAGSRVLVEALNAGELDLALVVIRGAEATAPGTELQPLLSEELVVVSAASGPAPRRRSGGTAGASGELSLRDLAELPQVAFSRSYDLRVATDAAFSAAGLAPTIAVEGAEMDAVLRFVERGIGVAVVPAMVVSDRPGLRSTRLVRPQLTRTVALARRTDVAPSAAMTAMLQQVFETVDALAMPGIAATARRS
ncbi:LysR family transcriptional regulator [Agrococcus baldri]|uniref:LysR family transcriptional regulator n=1 Tax=Agrococcus baldri TaxID=153730 RepID=A0AA87RCT6_9MICO|nr:LysR substrate-binding domain-containing protein [Agrococcus baldri]GEK80614.1 LysR family transcriptional regulator [Agrococcus baldri]